MLLPVTTFERQAVGLFALDTSARGFTTDLEGGYVGQIVPGVGTQHNTPVVARFNPASTDGYGSDTDLSLVGLMDDSSTGSKNSGVGNTGVIGKLLPPTSAGTALGFSSTAGSGKGTIWIEPGIFITDQVTNASGVGIVVGCPLYVTSTGKLSTVVSGPIIARVLQVFTGGLANVSVKELLGVLPRTQPLPAGTVLTLIKFK